MSLKMNLSSDNLNFKIEGNSLIINLSEHNIDSISNLSFFDKSEFDFGDFFKTPINSYHYNSFNKILKILFNYDINNKINYFLVKLDIQSIVENREVILEKLLNGTD